MGKWIFAFVFLTFIFIGVVSAVEFPNYQNKYVNDFAGILGDGQRQELLVLFSSIDGDTTAEIVFVSLDSIGSYDISQYAVELGQKWGVGKKDKDNGLLILYVKDIGRIYAATGYGLEGILPDSKVGRILDENYVPYRDSGNLSEGIVGVGKEFAQVVSDNKEEVLSGQAAPKNDYGFFGLIVGFFVFIGIFMYLISARKKKKGFIDFWDFFFADFIARMIVGIIFSRRGRGSGSSSGGFGGGGFGGGGFGGGGAGR